ncbi:MAG: hypothetical protein HY293_16965 [Planctomycetes bacterium]|nr:hypothetical protein [Planctomycetota bacterium]
MAKAWMEYVATGAVGDATPPPAATNVSALLQDGLLTVAWSAEADLESGIKAFVIQCNGKDIAQVPEKPVGKFGRPLYQSMSYHDTPEKLPTGMSCRVPPCAGACEYRVIVVNSVDLRSAPSQPALIK